MQKNNQASSIREFYTWVFVSVQVKQHTTECLTCIHEQWGISGSFNKVGNCSNPYIYLKTIYMYVTVFDLNLINMYEA